MEFGISRYELDTKSVLADTNKIAHLINFTDGALQRWIRLSCSSIVEFQGIKLNIISSAISRVTSTRGTSMSSIAFQAPVPRDIDAVSTGKLKGGKGKSKGDGFKGKGLGPPPGFQGGCTNSKPTTTTIGCVSTVATWFTSKTCFKCGQCHISKLCPQHGSCDVDDQGRKWVLAEGQTQVSQVAEVAA